MRFRPPQTLFVPGRVDDGQRGGRVGPVGEAEGAQVAGVADDVDAARGLVDRRRADDPVAAGDGAVAGHPGQAAAPEHRAARGVQRVDGVRRRGDDDDVVDAAATVTPLAYSGAAVTFPSTPRVQSVTRFAAVVGDSDVSDGANPLRAASCSICSQSAPLGRGRRRRRGRAADTISVTATAAGDPVAPGAVTGDAPLERPGARPAGVGGHADRRGGRPGGRRRRQPRGVGRRREGQPPPLASATATDCAGGAEPPWSRRRSGTPARPTAPASTRTTTTRTPTPARRGRRSRRSSSPGAPRGTPASLSRTGSRPSPCRGTRAFRRPPGPAGRSSTWSRPSTDAAGTVTVFHAPPFGAGIVPWVRSAPACDPALA